ncbi:MAG: response regulator [Acidobacteriaceae bacterium]
MAESRTVGRVLVIDDQDASRYVFRRILSHAGYTVDEATTGTEGLKLALTLPDVIIADVNLPDMLGYEVCRRLRSNPFTASIPVLQVSASFVSDESKVQALQGGADSYLTQPIEPTVLIAQVNALLRLRLAEAHSSLSARQWQTTFDALSDGLALVNSTGVIVRVNRSLLKMFDFVPSEFEGRQISSLFESRLSQSFERFLADGGAAASVEIFANNRYFRVRFDQIDGDPQNDSGFVLLVADITDQKKLQETLKLSERLAATGRFAHIIAHEINNPLEAMSNLLFLAARSDAAHEERQEYLRLASNELIRISQITKQVLSYHRQSEQPLLTKADELLDGVIAMFRAQMLLGAVRLDYISKCRRLLNVHPGEIRQVFTNLISNGLDAIAPLPGKLRIRCADATDQITSRRGVRFVFSDTGSGIAADVYPRIFDAFYTTKELKGSGIGLWLSAELIAKHTGRISVRTRTDGPYRGTLFSVFLPAEGPHDSATGY